MDTAKGGADSASVRALIERTLHAHGDAVMRGDPIAAAEVFAEDVRWMLPDLADMNGIGAVSAFIARAFASGRPPRDVWHTTEELHVFGDVAVELGSVRSKVESQPGGDLVPFNQRYMLMWKRQEDGTWRIFRDISNNCPPAEGR